MGGKECSGRGLCVGGACVCVSGVGGAACNELYSSAVDARLQGAAVARVRQLDASHQATQHGSGGGSSGSGGGGGGSTIRLAAASSSSSSSSPMHRAAEQREATTARRGEAGRGAHEQRLGHGSGGPPGARLPRIGAAAALQDATAAAAQPPQEQEQEPSFLQAQEGQEGQGQEPSRRLLFRMEQAGRHGGMAPPASRDQLLAGGGYSSSREDGGPASSLRSATAAERARGAAPAHVWPGGASSASLGVHASSAAVVAAPARAVAMVSSSAAPAAASQAGCLADCSGHGQCSRSQCFCDPGWGGADCARQAACPEGDCAGHGGCDRGLCFCDVGFGGLGCLDMMACPNDCGGHGSCHLSACTCDVGWLGADCGQQAPPDTRQGLPWWGVLLLQAPLVLLGGGAGWGVKWWYDRRSRQRMRTILQAEAQRPFVSAPPGS